MSDEALLRELEADIERLQEQNDGLYQATLIVGKERDTLRRRLAKVSHNHVTRDIKPPGKCQECDRYWDRQRAQLADELAKALGDLLMSSNTNPVLICDNAKSVLTRYQALIPKADQ